MYMLYIMLIALATPSLIALINSLGISLEEQGIGIMRAIGHKKTSQRIIVLESVLLSGPNLIIGLFSGLWLGKYSLRQQG